MVTSKQKGSPPPYLVAIINIEARRNGCCQEVAPVWSPLTCDCNIVPADQAVLATGLQNHQRHEMMCLERVYRTVQVLGDRPLDPSVSGDATEGSKILLAITQQQECSFVRCSCSMTRCNSVQQVRGKSETDLHIQAEKMDCRRHKNNGSTCASKLYQSHDLCICSSSKQPQQVRVGDKQGTASELQ